MLDHANGAQAPFIGCRRLRHALTTKTALLGTAAHLLIAFPVVTAANGPLFADLPQLH